MEIVLEYDPLLLLSYILLIFYKYFLISAGINMIYILA